jgi:hypothetical protein
MAGACCPDGALDVAVNVVGSHLIEHSRFFGTISAVTAISAVTSERSQRRSYLGSQSTIGRNRLRLRTAAQASHGARVVS